MQKRHEKSRNSSLLCTIYAERLFIHRINSFYQNIFIKHVFETCKVLSLHFPTQTQSNVVPSIYCYPSSDFSTIEICVVQNPSRGIFHHLCISDTPSI